MNKRIQIRYSSMLWALLLLSLLTAPGAAQSSACDCDPPGSTTKKEGGATTGKAQDNGAAGLFESLRTTLEIGGQFRDLDGERPSKFQEYRRVREGFLFKRFRLASNPEGSPFFFRLTGRGPSELDEEFFFEGGKYGRFRTKAQWGGLPHVYSSGSKSLFGSSARGVYTVADSIQQTLQNTPDVDLPAAVRNYLAAAPPATLRVQRQTLKLDQTLDITDNWSVRFRLLDDKRYGSKPLGNGSYERIGTPTGDTFRVLAVELPEPVDYRSDQLTFGTSYVRAKYGINFDYTYSQFRNRISTLIFENPFRLTDAQGNPPSGATGRLRFSRGIYDLAPDNEAHSFLVSGWVDLPHDSRWASALGWGFWRQNDDFVPFTSNSAIVATGLPPGTNPTQVEALPERSLDGKIDTFTQDHLFASRLTDSLRLNLHYRYYDYDNQTPIIHWPGYAAYNESFWRTNIVSLPTTPPTPVPIENEPPSFVKQNASAEVVWDVTEEVKWKLEYELEAWNRRHRQVARSNEHSIGTTLSLKPWDRWSAKINYRYSDRIPIDYNSGLKEFRLLRMFDQSRRLRHDVDLQWQVNVNPQLGLSGTLGYWSDDYDQNFLGLAKYIQGYGSIDVLYTPRENATIYANYSRERISSLLLSIAKTAAPFNLNNRWDRQNRDVVDSFGIGVTGYLAGERLVVDSHYAFSLAGNRITTANPLAIIPADTLNAQASIWPEATSRFHEWNSEVSYQLTANWGLGFRYIYEPYRLDDYAWNGLQPYPFSDLAPQNDGRRFLLLDSRYSSYDANVVGVYLRFSFGGKKE